MKSQRTLPLRGEGNTHVAAYESYLDLFTLLSFILIITAFIYVTKFESGSQNMPPVVTQPDASAQIFSSVVAQVAEHGTGVPQKLPNDSLLLVIYREDSIDKLAVIGGEDVSTNQMVITLDSAERILNDLLATFNRVKVIDIAVYKGKEDVNPAIFLAVSRWLTHHKFIKYNLYYSGS